MNVIERVRQDREDLARVLKKHAGIRRIVEDLYPDTAHFIYELLQNAEDTGASEAAFVLSEDRLVFEHNGRTFDEADLRAITDIGEGTKAEDDEQIGRFGIGFKAVFAYTETPRIWSPSYAFEISEMVLPSEIPPNPALSDRTRFEFPFNSRKKPQIDAFSEVQDGLEDISDNTLLFLSNIEEIHWQVDGGREGRLLRIPRSDHHIEILREIDGRPTESSHFLRFTEPVDALEQQHTAIAFELEPLPGNIQSDARASFARQFRIVPAERGRVAVYFTAAKETSNLRFHLHAPFVPELSRSSIKNTPANEPLFQQLARLAALSLSAIRDLGLLDRDFLAVLPNSQDEIPSQYTTIRDAIVGAMNEQPLTPMHAGGHAPASRLLQAEAGLKDLLDRDDIRFLIDGHDDPRNWAIAATQRNSRVDRFLRGLDIEQWGVEQFVKALGDRFSNRPRLCRTTYTWRRGPDRPVSRLDAPEIGRLAPRTLFPLPSGAAKTTWTGSTISASSDSRTANTEQEANAISQPRRPAKTPFIPALRKTLTQDGGTKDGAEHGARAFLEGIGVREVGPQFQQVEAILETAIRRPRPRQKAMEDPYESDLQALHCAGRERTGARARFLFSRTISCIAARPTVSVEPSPGGLYLDTPLSCETGLDGLLRSRSGPRHSVSGCIVRQLRGPSTCSRGQFIPFVVEYAA